jgi:hypothetical protein
MTATRRLAAILAVNVVGNSRLMGEGEEGTVQPHRAGSKSGMVAHGCRSASSSLRPARRVQAPAQKRLTLCAERDVKAMIPWVGLTQPPF